MSISNRARFVEELDKADAFTPAQVRALADAFEASLSEAPKPGYWATRLGIPPFETRR